MACGRMPPRPGSEASGLRCGRGRSKMDRVQRPLRRSRAGCEVFSHPEEHAAYSKHARL